MKLLFTFKVSISVKQKMKVVETGKFTPFKFEALLRSGIDCNIISLLYYLLCFGKFTRVRQCLHILLFSLNLIIDIIPNKFPSSLSDPSGKLRCACPISFFHLNSLHNQFDDIEVVLNHKGFTIQFNKV